MKTLDLKCAAALLKIHPQTLLLRARSGSIPAAKPGKCWVFIEEDLIHWLRSQYPISRQEVSAATNGGRTCSLKEKKVITGISSLPSEEKLYTDLLAPVTRLKHKK
ncbi:MAG TPA: DNA-binding protein [Methyloprofundus sp.]|nr:DNA-binding protein [Methyloprofundus sp.]